MKTIISILLMIPAFGFAQINTEALNSFYGENFRINQTIKRQLEVANPEEIIHSNTLASNFSIAGNENKMLLDSTYLLFFHSATDTSRTVRKYFKYDNRGNQVLSVEYDGKHTPLTNFKTCEGCMGASFKTQVKFDENNHVTERINFLCNSAAKQWVEIRKAYSTYDINGIMTSSSLCFLNENGKWVGPTKSVYEYYTVGDYAFSITMRYDSITDQWINSKKGERFYENNLCIRRTEYNWNKQTSQWANSTKEELEYDTSGNNTSRADYNWDKQTSTWNGSYKYQYAYSSEGKLTNSTNSTWDKNTSQWINVNKTDYTFDINGNEIEELYSLWDTIAGKWIGRQRYESSYNDKGYLNSEITYLGWSKTDGTLDISSKDDYEYDSNGNNISVTSYYWNLPENAWSIRTKTNNYYSLHDLTNKVDIKENLNVRLYPNPVDETFTLEINDNLVTQCHLYNSNGQLLQTMVVKQGVNTYNISHLKQGMYLLKIKTEEGTVVKKVIKK